MHFTIPSITAPPKNVYIRPGYVLSPRTYLRTYLGHSHLHAMGIEGNETNNMIHILVFFDRNIHRLHEMKIDFVFNIQMIIWIIINAKQLYPNHLSRSRITKLMLKSQQGKVKCLKNKNQELVFLPFLCYRYVVKISWSCFSFLSFVCLSVGICVHFIIAWNET